MKKGLILACGAIVASLGLTGCMSTNTSEGAYAPEVVIKKEYTPIIKHQETMVSGDATIYCLFGFIIWGTNEFADESFTRTSNAGAVSLLFDPNTAAKQGATYNALDAADADMLLGAKYELDIEDYFVFKKIKANVSGYPGVVKGFK